MIIFAADRKRHKARRAHIDDRYYAARITYVGSVETGNLGTIKGDFMTRKEYLAEAGPA